MNPASLRIRHAESRDAPAILELYRQLVRPVAPDVAIDVRTERIEQIRRDPHNFLWVIESDQEVFGTTFVTLCLDPMHGRQPYAVLEKFCDRRTSPHQGVWCQADALRSRFLL
jgi:hypothetical protein